MHVRAWCSQYARAMCDNGKGDESFGSHCNGVGLKPDQTEACVGLARGMTSASQFGSARQRSQEHEHLHLHLHLQ